MRYILTVTETNKYIKELFTRDIILSRIWIRGEISNYKYHTSGHMYFTIKDETSLIKCVMFRTQNSTLRFKPENGLKVIIGGSVSVFERDGQYQLYAESMEPDGIGALHMAFEQLKKKLSIEGLFDDKYKKRIPLISERIGVVTSSTGSVVRDIINVLCRRFPNIHIKIFPVAVQGEGASRQIANAIRKLNELSCVDVIILARGGGSLEELWAFNEEIVARSIFASKIPIISAIGHETDFTISDFVADLRAPTPSAAAELVVMEKMVLRNNLNTMNNRLANALTKSLILQKSRLQRVIESSAFKQPYDRVYQERMRLDMLGKSISRSMKTILSTNKSSLALLVGKLDAMSPLTVLSRGYSIVKAKGSQEIIKSVSNVKQGSELEIQMADGRISCIVNDIENPFALGGNNE